MKLKPKQFRSPLAAALLLATSTTLTLCAADYPTTVLGFNPLAYWRLDETAASPPVNKVANSGTLGSSADGFIVLDVGKGEAGRVGNAIRLVNNGNAVGYAGSKIDVPYSAALNPTAPFSVEFWAKPNGFGADTTGFCPLSSFNPNAFGGANRSGWLFYLNNTGRWQFRLGLNSGYAIQLNAATSASVGVWQHIVATYDGATCKIYVNGVLSGSGVPSSGWVPNTQMALRMGGTSLTGTLSDGPANSATGISGNRCFDGWLDEVAIYSTLLSDSTVAAHFAAATTNSGGYSAQIVADSPLGYWNMNEPAVVAPDPATFPIVANSGSLGSAADGTNMWGSLGNQPGSGYAGAGAGNKAAVLNGESGYIALQDAAGLHFSGNITLMAWVKPGVKDFFRDIIAHGWDGNYAETFLRITRSGNLDLNDPGAYGDGQNYYEVGVTDGAGYYDSAMFAIPAGDIGNWVHLAGTYDGTGWKLYRNGVLVASLPSENGALDVTPRWSIGSRSNPPEVEGLFFGGSIDEPAIFNTALSAGNINSLFNAAQVPPVITRAPQAPQAPLAPPATIYSGFSASFSVWADGSPALAHLWTSNGISTGVTATNLTLNNFTAGTKTIAAVVTNPYGSATSSVTFTVLDSPPLVIQQPVPVSRYTGFPFTFSISAGGSIPLTYQWKTNGINISGATGTSYSGVASAANALNYSCLLSNSFGTSNSAPVALTVLSIPGGYPGSVLTSAPPVAYLRLGETSGSVAVDSAGGHDGVYHNATLNQPGYSVIDPDKAASFGAVNSYVGGIDVGFNSTPGNLHTNFSIEVWVNGPAGQGDESTVIAKGNGSSGTTATEQFGIDVVGGNYRFFTRGGGNSLYEADASTGPNDTWQHIVGVYDDSNGQLYIYVNGEVQGQATTRPAGIRSSTDPVTIGSKHLGNDPNYDGFFTGTIDEVALYNSALSSSQILAHYAAAYGPSLAPFIALQPASLTNYVSLPAKFTVSAAGTVPLTYQWKKGGVDISGATSSTYLIPSLVLGDAGSYSVGITNVNGGLLSGSAVLTVLPVPVTPPAIPGLVIHLPFDNTLADATGRGNNGTGIRFIGTSSNTAAPTFVTDGKLGQGLHFSTDASVTNNEYVTIGDRSDFHFSSNVNFTVSYWVRAPFGYALGDLPFLTTTVGSTFGSGLVFAYTYGPATANWPGGWAMSCYDVNGNGVGGRGEIGSINDGNWHHLVHVFDRKVGNVNYLDGVQVRFNKQAGTSVTAAGNVDTLNALTVGQDPTGLYGESGAGDIDDIGVWKKALTPLEAASIYMAATASGVSFTGAPITISLEKSGSNLKISWTAGVLQSADTVNGTYSDVPGASSPWTVAPTAARKFYRARL